MELSKGRCGPRVDGECLIYGAKTKKADVTPTWRWKWPLALSNNNNITTKKKIRLPTNTTDKCLPSGDDSNI